MLLKEVGVKCALVKEKGHSSKMGCFRAWTAGELKDIGLGAERSFGISDCWGTRGGSECEGLGVGRSCHCLWHPPLLGTFLTHPPCLEHTIAHTHTDVSTQLLFIFFAAVRNMVLSLTTSWPPYNIVPIPKDTAKFLLI